MLIYHQPTTGRPRFFVEEMLNGGGGGDISDDILLEIFLFLPVNSLLRFRFVCKYWFNLITTNIHHNTRFVQLHIHHHHHHYLSTNATTIDNFPTILSTSSIMYSTPNHNLYSLNNNNNNAPASSSSKNNKEASIIEIVYPFKSSSSQLKILGSCNGLLCIQVVNSDVRHDDLKAILCLWNPTTHEFKRLPGHVTTKVKSTYGFGYDRVIDDYKLVTFRNHSHNELKVYTLGTNSWEWVDKEIPHNLLDRLMEVGLYVDGGLHWISNGIIYSFNIEDEEFREMDVPIKHWWMVFGVKLQVMRGCLCIFNSYIDQNLKCVVHEVWMMMDYGVNESWTKLFRAMTRLESFENLKPLWICKDGKVLSGMDGHCYENLVIYDPKNNMFESIGIQAIPFNWRNAIVHIGSFVSLKSGTYVDQEEVKNNNPRQKKKQKTD